MLYRSMSAPFRIVLVIALVLVAFTGLNAHAQAAEYLKWVTPKPGADLVKLKASIKARGGKVLTLAPEGRLLVRYPSATVLQSGVSAMEAFEAPASRVVSSAAPTGRGLGAVRPTPEDEARLNARLVTSVAPDSLGTARATLQDGLASLPSSADNSLSIYFPPIDSQGGLNACTAWATTYYYNTYEQARDENLNASSGNVGYLCNPMFVYNLINGGQNVGTSIESAMGVLNRSGAATQATMTTWDYTVWPAEAAWVEALKRRTQSANVIGSWYQGCNDNDILAIKQHLANGHIAVTLADIYQNLYNTYPGNTTGVNNAVLFGPGGSCVGGHAMTIVGYDDNKSYWNGSTTKYGAFLLANSWGGNWGTYNTGSAKGFLWVAYDYFKTGSTGDGHYVFGTAYFNTDRAQYRSKLYAAAGLNHSRRGYLTFLGGSGAGDDSYWESDYILAYSGGTSVAIDDTNRVVVDLNDGIPHIAFPAVDVFARVQLSGGASTNGSIANTTFFHDFDGNGTYDEVQAANTPQTVTPGGHADALALFTWSDGAIDHFSMNAVGSPQYAYAPIAAAIAARDNLDRTVTGFTGTATISASNITTSTIGAGTVEAWIPLTTYYTTYRTQSIYLQSEVGAANNLKGLCLNVTGIPGRAMQNFTIRLKHTSLSAFPSGSSWQTGFTTVYQHDTNIAKKGWTLFPFDTEFAYNGTDHLMVDFSFNNSAYSDYDGWVYHTNTGANRTTQGGGDWMGDPLGWTGTFPILVQTTIVPNIMLLSSRDIAVTPSVTGNFTAGVWSGSVTIDEPATNVYLTLSDGAGHVGVSNTFNVLAAIPPGSLTVTIEPFDAVAAGAQWRRFGQSTWHASGSTESGVAAGSHTVEFNQAPGWNTPAPRLVTVSSGETAAVSGAYTRMSSVWVDFTYGGAQFGTESQPFRDLGSGVSAVTSGGTVYIKTGTSNERPRLTKPMRIESVGGAATIGR